jgi:UDP-N-acetylmuramate dehydrogenase
MKHNLEDSIIEIVGKENIKLDEPMSKHTTFQIGGPANILQHPTASIFCFRKWQQSVSQ